MSERMENSLLTKSQRQLEINEIFYLNLRQKEEHSSTEGNCASKGEVVFPYLLECYQWGCLSLSR